MKIRIRKSTLLLLLVFIVGLGGATYSYHLAKWRNLQVDSYNLGVASMLKGDGETASKAFQVSAATYTNIRHLPWLVRFGIPQPNRELAALAYFQLGKLDESQDAEKASEDYKRSLLLNPGNGYQNVTYQEAVTLNLEAMYTKRALLRLFKNFPDLAAKQGKGGGTDPNGTGDTHVPGDDPSDGSKAGKGDPDDL
jgi:tetratricopeptide (TPR) repeat protein